MADGGLPPEAVPPDIKLKCHKNNKPVSLVFCILCDNVYHKSDFNRILEKGGKYISGLKIICSEHEDSDLTSNVDPRVQVQCLTSEVKEKDEIIEKLKYKNNNLIVEYNKLKSQYEGLLTEMRNSENMEEDDTSSKDKTTMALLQLENESLKKLNTELEDKNSVLKTLNGEREEKNKLLKQLLEREREIPKSNKKTYAEITTAVNIQPKIVPKITVKRKSEDDKSDMKGRVLHYLSKETKIQTKKISKGKNNEITISCMNEESAKLAQRTLQYKLSNRYNIEKEQPKNPIVKIIGIDKGIKLDKNSLEKDINERNFANHLKKAKVLHVFTNNRNNTQSAIVEVTPEMHKQIKSSKDRLFFAYQNCKVFDIVNVKPCYKCSRIGHSSTKCWNTPVCQKCAGDHLTRNCEGNTTVKCANCNYNNIKYGTTLKSDHIAIDTDKCEILKAKIKKYISSTNYEVKPDLPRYLGTVGNFKKNYRIKERGLSAEEKYESQLGSCETLASVFSGSTESLLSITGQEIIAKSRNRKGSETSAIL